MITSIFIDGFLKIVSIRLTSNGKKVARVYDPRGHVPEKVLTEIGQNLFSDPVEDKYYRINVSGGGMIGV